MGGTLGTVRNYIKEYCRNPTGRPNMAIFVQKAGNNFLIKITKKIVIVRDKLCHSLLSFVVQLYYGQRHCWVT